MDACNLHKIALNSDVEKEFTKRFSHAGTANEKKKLDFSNCQLSDVHVSHQSLILPINIVILLYVDQMLNESAMFVSMFFEAAIV